VKNPLYKNNYLKVKFKWWKIPKKYQK